MKRSIHVGANVLNRRVQQSNYQLGEDHIRSDKAASVLTPPKTTPRPNQQTSPGLTLFCCFCPLERTIRSISCERRRSFLFRAISRNGWTTLKSAVQSLGWGDTRLILMANVAPVPCEPDRPGQTDGNTITPGISRQVSPTASFGIVRALSFFTRSL